MIDCGYRPFTDGVGIIQRYIPQPGYIAGLILGPRGPHYNRVPLYSKFSYSREDNSDQYGKI